MFDLLFKFFLILTPPCIAGLAIFLIEKICKIYETHKDITNSLIKLLIKDNLYYFENSTDPNFTRYIETYLYQNTSLSRREIRKFIKTIEEDV